MGKNKFIQIRVTETLYDRYMAALKTSGLNKTEHLTSEIFKFAESQASKNPGEGAVLRLLSEMQMAEGKKTP